MEFAFTEEQLMIRDTAAGFLAEVSTSEAIRASMATDRGYDETVWQQVCQDLVWPALHIPEQYGGMGLGYVELVAMLEQMGRFLFCSPFYASVCLAANALLVAGTEEQKQQWLPKIAQGTVATLAYTGAVAGQKAGVWNSDAITATAERNGNGFVLNGNYRYVVDGTNAELLIVAARQPGTTSENGISLFAIPAMTKGVSVSLLPTMDQTRKQAEVVLQNVQLTSSALMAEEGNAASKLNSILNLAIVALSAEQIGGAQQTLDMAVAYTKERVQFGRAIASFQAIKHKAADMMLRVEVARSGVYYAACVAQETMECLANNATSPLAQELDEAASVAKSYCSDAYFKNAGDCLQMHGGVGFTWEYDVHLHFKRAKSSEHFLGTASWHRERLASILLDDTQLAAEQERAS